MATTLLQRLGTAFAGTVGRRSAPARLVRPLYEAALRVTSGARGLAWTVNGIPCRIDVAERARMARVYEPEVARFLAPRVAAGAVTFDLGANVGVYALQFAHWSAPGGRVFAFEPNPEARRVLGRHIELNGLQERVEVVPRAVGSAPGPALFFAAGADGMSRVGAPNPVLPGTRTTTVDVTTVDRFCAERGVVPDWVFIDIEGHEAAALAGARETLHAHPKLEVVAEMHPPLWAASGTDLAGVRRVLADLRLEPVPLTGQVDPLAEHGIVHLRRR